MVRWATWPGRSGTAFQPSWPSTAPETVARRGDRRTCAGCSRVCVETFLTSSGWWGERRRGARQNRNRYVPRGRQRPPAVVRVQCAQSAGVGGLAVFHVEHIAVVTGRCRQPNWTRQTLIEEAEGKMPVESGLLPAVETA